MSSNAYTEDQLVEQPAIGLFAAFGWHGVGDGRNLRRGWIGNNPTTTTSCWSASSASPVRYTCRPDLGHQKCSAVFEHVYESYPERNAGVYA